MSWSHSQVGLPLLGTLRVVDKRRRPHSSDVRREPRPPVMKDHTATLNPKLAIGPRPENQILDANLVWKLLKLR